MKIYLTESFSTQIIKGTIDIEPSNYPELEGKTEDEILDYLNRNSQDMYLTKEDEEMDWSIYDVLSEQETVREKEKNYETNIYIEEN